jgi:osmotically-inducible protein OsmY
VLARLEKAKLDQRGDIEVALEDGRVILTGMVTTVDAKRAVEKAALKEAKVVENRLSVHPEEERTDLEIRKDIEKAVLSYTRYTVFDSVAIAVKDGYVLLGGSVNQPYRSSDIERRIAKIPGVRAIENVIEVQRVSIFDDRLRTQLYRAIYSDPLFVRFSNRVNPPVRIIVDRGRVTLTGVVATNVEQQKLGHIARGTLAFGVDNRVQLESELPREEARSRSS